MIYLNKDSLRDKINACWLGKNIGGTIGTPYEGRQQINDIQGFSSPKGSALPNDDLDLQLVWLHAIDELGIEAINSKVLGEYWLNYVAPHWNEYGIGKANMKEGIIPPLSGQMFNDRWKNSNGAWIRTEIWACLNPGNVEKAIRYSFEDACVDHGYAEGTYGAIFVAAMESAAFLVQDIQKLLDIGLSKIPADCELTKLITIVRKAYADGLTWKEAREKVMAANTLGWFQAPANIAFAVIGLLYGKGDFKQSVILAVNCGDDTDCTGATVGALLGIMYGTAVIPQEWRAYIGDDIVSIAIIKGHNYWPQNCTELTDFVMHLLPSTTRLFLYDFSVSHQGVTVYDGEDAYTQEDINNFYGDAFVKKMFCRSPYSFTVENVVFDTLIEFDKAPEIKPSETISGKISIIANRITCDHYELRWILPEGWSVQGKRTLFKTNRPEDGIPCVSFSLTAGESIQPVNRVLLEITSPGHLLPTYVPITIMG